MNLECQVDQCDCFVAHSVCARTGPRYRRPPLVLRVNGGLEGPDGVERSLPPRPRRIGEIWLR